MSKNTLYILPAAWENALDGWVSYLILQGHSPATRKVRRDHVRSVARRSGTNCPTELTGPALATLCGKPEWSQEHRKAIRASLVSFYAHCCKTGLVAEDPTGWLPRVRPALPNPRPATDDVWATLLTAPPRQRLMARLAGEAGLRRAEVAQAHRDDLIADRGGWSLIVKGKGGKQRVVPLTDDLAEEIRDYKGVDQTDTLAAGYLFPGKVDGHISVVYAGQLISMLMPPGWSIHKLRHRYASRGFAGTGNLRAVQEALGHASVATTQRYVAVSNLQVRAVSEAAASHGGAASTSLFSVAPEKHSDVEARVVSGDASTSARVNGDGDRRAPETTLRTRVLAQCVPLAVTKERVISMADVARCEVATLTTHHGAPCTRRANWRLDLHGCKQMLMCERDIQTWKRHQLEALYRGTRLGCVHCGQLFERLDDVCSITRL